LLPNFDGELRTTIGIVKLKQTGSAVTGTYGNAGQFTLKGTVEGKKLTFEYREGQASGDAQWTMDESGHSFRGGYKIRGGQAGGWQGWRPDPNAPKVMQAFDAIRAEHNGPAQKVLNEANAAFQQGRCDQGYTKYQVIVDKYYAASSYRNVKRWLAERK
jgi:hypothetical protein